MSEGNTKVELSEEKKQQIRDVFKNIIEEHIGPNSGLVASFSFDEGHHCDACNDTCNSESESESEISEITMTEEQYNTYINAKFSEEMEFIMPRIMKMQELMDTNENIDIVEIFGEMAEYFLNHNVCLHLSRHIRLPMAVSAIRIEKKLRNATDEKSVRWYKPIAELAPLIKTLSESYKDPVDLNADDIQLPDPDTYED